ncbi:MAG: nitrous oxide reductase accessory protein NosL [Gammaproteobacteria bacterium]|nr:nitrous oxide reductase accessory protein NosL [Gammaproteobacteria bacterium]MDX2460896.1 nitrous oxide reductase accessory protein NosL [Gammaproteobacteria bacterium]
MRIALTATVLATLMLVACSEEDAPQVVSAPAPIEITRDDIGYYCNMIVADHLGPKGQVHIDGRDKPVWFSSVRDTIVFTLLPEEPKNIAAIYVNDMGSASWEHPEAGTWIDARKAWYVVGSNKVGGMGAPEAVSFASKIDAQAFAGKHGGQVVAFDGVPRDYVLNDASQSMQADMHHEAADAHHASHTPAAMPMHNNGHGHADTKVVK